MRNRARDAGRRRKDTLEFWFRRKYNLPPTDPRFLDMTQEELLSEWYAHHFTENPNSEEFEDPDFDEEWEQFQTEALAEE